MKIRCNQSSITNFRKYQNSSTPSNLNFSKHLNSTINTKFVQTTQSSFLNYSASSHKFQTDDRIPLNFSIYKANIMAHRRDDKPSTKTVQNSDYKTSLKSFTKYNRSSIPSTNQTLNTVEYDLNDLSSYLRPTSYHQQFNAKPEKEKNNSDYTPMAFTNFHPSVSPVDEPNIDSIISNCTNYSTESNLPSNQYVNDQLTTKYRPSTIPKDTGSKTNLQNQNSSVDPINESHEIAISNYRKYAQNNNSDATVSIDRNDITSYHPDEPPKIHKFNFEDELANIINSASQMNQSNDTSEFEPSNRYKSGNDDIDSLLDIPIKTLSVSKSPVLLKDENNEPLDIQAKLAKFRETISLVKKTEEDYGEWFPQEKTDLPKNKPKESLNEANNEMLSEPSLIFADQEDEN